VTSLTDLPQVLVTPYELLRAAAGNQVRVFTSAGEEVCLRLPTLGELLTEVARQRDRLLEAGLSVPPPPTRAQLEHLVRPLTVSSGPATVLGPASARQYGLVALSDEEAVAFTHLTACAVSDGSQPALASDAVSSEEPAEPGPAEPYSDCET
jgi:hypothetical protein